MIIFFIVLVLLGVGLGWFVCSLYYKEVMANFIKSQYVMSSVLFEINKQIEAEKEENKNES